ncbi:hypothetical protein AB1Y20_001090 [Prymnesium parvum]|uniref:Uncharacterized protein n=1 Tax=Prymnesium parvum TaxID=97485 RepID=A0AB34JFY8_PRYPA
MALPEFRAPFSEEAVASAPFQAFARTLHGVEYLKKVVIFKKSKKHMQLMNKSVNFIAIVHCINMKVNFKHSLSLFVDRAVALRAERHSI